jgi:hypothetical protein
MTSAATSASRTRPRASARRSAELVTREGDRWGIACIRGGSEDDQRVLDALERARVLHGDVAAVVRYLERGSAPAIARHRDPIRPIPRPPRRWSGAAPLRSGCWTANAPANRLASASRLL